MAWLVRSERFPDAVVPARDEAHCCELVAQFREVATHHQARVAWEYGMHDPAEPNSYRRIGPRGIPTQRTGGPADQFVAPEGR